MSNLLELIQLWELFIVNHPEGNAKEFARWVFSRDKNESMQSNIVPFKISDSEKFRADDSAFDRYSGNQKTSMQASYLLSKMNQYIILYTKPIMKKYGLHSIDDFGYLQTVRKYNNINKTKACELMMHEITTGVDIIKRLIRHGFMKERTNKKDKREKLLQLTTKGEKTLNDMYFDFLHLPDTLGEMKESDRSTLINWLMQLDIYHENAVKYSLKT